ncbi:MAG TPA: YncE family protein [Thermoplasmata archaeon]|nr:YncE family protein [Thermoplasmata archaeon]
MVRDTLGRTDLLRGGSGAPGVGPILLIVGILLLLTFAGTDPVLRSEPTSSPAPTGASAPGGALGFVGPASSTAGGDRGSFAEPAAATSPAVTPAAPIGPNLGKLIATVAAQSYPSEGTYNRANGDVYVTNALSNSVTVINGTTPVATIRSLPTYPVGAAWNPVNGLVYVASFNANEVSWISGTSVSGSVIVGTHPDGVVYNPANQDIYVTNYGSADVTVISNTTIVANISVGVGPLSALYDPINSDVYVANYASNTVSVIHGTSVVKTTHVGGNPEGLAFDAATTEVYVTNTATQNVSVLLGTTVVNNFPLATTGRGIVYDPGNGYMYVADNMTNNVTVLNGTVALGDVSVGAGPIGLVYDDGNGCVYVADGGSATVSILSTALLELPLTASPLGNPANSSDLPASVTLNASLLLNASWSYSATLATSPSSGLGCPASPGVLVQSSGGSVSALCTPTTARAYLVWINVSAVGRISSSASMTFTVFPNPTATTPTANIGARLGVTAADVGLHVGFNETPAGGTGVFSNFLWAGFPSGSCFGTSSSHPTCVFTKAGTVTLTVTATDSNGRPVVSTPLSFPVNPLPTTTTPVASRTTADVGQSVGFSTKTSGGTPPYTYLWRNLPGSCTGATTATPTCTPTTNGTVSAALTVTDSVGGTSSPSTHADVLVFSDPVVTQPVAIPQTLSAGELFSVSVTVSGGPSNGTLNWSGLPLGCTFSLFNATCRTNQGGVYNVFATFTDGNQFVAKSPSTTVTVRPSNNPGGPGGLGGGGSVLGIPAAAFYGLLAVIALAIIAAAVLALRRAGPRPDGYVDEGEETGAPLDDEPPGSAGETYEDAPEEAPYETDDEGGGVDAGSEDPGSETPSPETDDDLYR